MLGLKLNDVSKGGAWYIGYILIQKQMHMFLG